MHGVKRDRSQLTAELKAQRKEREAKKLHLYLDIEARFFAKRDADDLSTEALESTSLVLNINPELYSAWNFRRRILLHLFEHGEGAPPQTDLFASLRDDAGEEAGQASSSKEGGAIDSGSHDERHTDRRARKKQLLQEDLELTMQALQMHPKVYWIWNHRKWCLQCLPSDDVDGLAKWKMEIGMANKMLDYDPRNCEYVVENVYCSRRLKRNACQSMGGITEGTFFRSSLFLCRSVRGAVLHFRSRSPAFTCPMS